MVAEMLKCKTEWGYSNVLVHFVSLKLRILETCTKCITTWNKN